MSLFTNVRHFAYSASRYIPWSYNGTIRRNVVDGSVLDVGCGKGWAWKFSIDKSRRQRYYSVGIDISPDYIGYCVDHKLYNEAICGDVRQLQAERKKFDVVLILQVLSHLDKDAGIKLLKTAESVANKQIIVATENGIVDLPEKEHISPWTQQDFEEMGYKVMGFGLKPVGLNTKFAHAFINMSRFSSLLPFTYWSPSSAYQMIAIKKMR